MRQMRWRPVQSGKTPIITAYMLDQFKLDVHKDRYVYLLLRDKHKEPNDVY